MLVPIFTLKLNHKVNPRTVAIGHYDGTHPALTCGTAAGKVWFLISLICTTLNNYFSFCIFFIHEGKPHNISLKFPSCKNNILCLLFIFTNGCLCQCPDGANALTIGKLGSIESPLAIVGGNCSIQGYNKDGEDSFWTVTGDTVQSLCLLDFNNNGQNELIVGSEDFDIRVFQEDEIIAEMTETEIITCLCPITNARFGYALANGTVGVYDRSTRYWRIKSKNQAVSIHAYDLNGDGVPELITGWTNGKVDARSDTTGEVIFKDNFNQALAGIVQADYRMDSSAKTGDQLLCVSVDGEVRGYAPATGGPGSSLMDGNVEQDTIRELSQRKQVGCSDVKSYSLSGSGIGELGSGTMGMIPANTQLQTTLSVNTGDQTKPVSHHYNHLLIFIFFISDTIIRAVLIFAEGIFEGESHVVHPNNQSLSSNLKVPIIPPKDIPVDLHIKALIGQKNSTQYHVFELTRQLPRFSMYNLVNSETTPDPRSHVSFTLNERPQRMLMWINQNFLLHEDLSCEGDLYFTFVSLRGAGPLKLRMSHQGQVAIHTDDMDVAGDVIQSLAQFLNIDDLQTTADFPVETETLRQILIKVDEFHRVRSKLTAEMADHSNLIRSMVVRAEDARIMGDMRSMRKGYMELYDLNRDLISGYNIRCQNHNELVACLKQVNQIIQKAGRVRVGKFKSQVISSCRSAIKNNNTASLFKIIYTGMA
ncbi:hypothetical protein EGW08_021515 [Elysia chlorotica]|uniref:Bardet-Biedl syndrome 2 protein homolog n=1 Tax=Elysia chlorotica TaxID=188477 RepID=A0A3S0Z4T9_ELYCH|nr:hypothetical protein EGW08_021515 [Elysia chlorotica]